METPPKEIILDLDTLSQFEITMPINEAQPIIPPVVDTNWKSIHVPTLTDEIWKLFSDTDKFSEMTVNRISMLVEMIETKDFWPT